MSLPNYSPQGIIRLGCVPWNNSYTHIRYYDSLDAQLSDITSMCAIATMDYVYIGRNRTIKVDMEADRLYHVNYMMYRNPSITNRWIYCFITDVKYINDHTTELAIETDIFQTYLYGVDWTLPACMIERAHSATESERLMVTPEPDFPLLYNVDDVNRNFFQLGAVVVVTADVPIKDTSINISLINPDGYKALKAPTSIYRGVANGCAYYVFPLIKDAGGNVTSEYLETFLSGLTQAGAVDSIVAIMSVPSFAQRISTEGLLDVSGKGVQQTWNDAAQEFSIPARGKLLNGYKPKNRKLLYYPYNFCRVTDYQGSVTDLRYELMGNTVDESGTVIPMTKIKVKYEINPSCQAYAYPTHYRGLTDDVESGFTTSCGALGSWSTDTYKSWMAQNSGIVGLNVAKSMLTMAGGTMPINTAAANYIAEANGTDPLPHNEAARVGAISSGAVGLLDTAAQVDYMTRQPDHVHGQTNYSTMWTLGMQGIVTERMALTPEYAEQIDRFFDVFGYAYGRVSAFSLSDAFWSAHPYWGYIKTQGANPRSMNVASTTAVPVSGGRGTPASVLRIIASVFDSGTTFWNTTSGFGDYSQNNHAS